MKRSPIKRSAPMRKRGESRDNAILRDARAAALERDEYACQAEVRGLRHDCTMMDYGALHVHHILRRSQGGLDHPSNLITLCTAAHEWVHAFPSAAYELGLLQRSGDAECLNCHHVSRLHAASSGQCTWGPYGHGCSCTRFVEAAA